MKKKQKKEVIISDLKNQIEQSEAVIVSNYCSLSANKINILRSELNKVGAYLKVAKNSLLRLAIKDTTFSIIDHYCTGAIILGITNSDLIDISKVISNFSKKNKELVILGGSTNGRLLSINDIRKIGNTPSIEVMKSQMAYTIKSPVISLAKIMQKPIIDLALLLDKKSKK